MNLRPYTLITLAALISFALGSHSFADVSFDFGSSHTDASNLLNDANDFDDAYTSSDASLTFYPLSSLEWSLKGDYTYYKDFIGLGNYSLGTGMTFIPLSADSRTPLHFSSNFSGRLYREGFQDFDNNTFDISGTIGYNLSTATQMRGGLAYNSTAYVRTESSDQESFTIFTGCNASFLGSNAIDIEVGYSFASYTYIEPIDPEFPILDPNFRFVKFTDGTLKSLSFSPRYSRPLGSKTGLSVLFTYREFFDHDEAIVLGSTFENLSPWSSVWQGRAVSLNLKTYLVPHFIVSGGVGYWNKSFLRIADLDVAFLTQVVERQDEQTKFFLNIQDPIVTGAGYVLETTLGFEYTNNTSSKPLYDYSGFNLSIGFRVRM